jgi:hypothetical protein
VFTALGISSAPASTAEALVALNAAKAATQAAQTAYDNAQTAYDNASGFFAKAAAFDKLKDAGIELTAAKANEALVQAVYDAYVKVGEKQTALTAAQSDLTTAETALTTAYNTYYTTVKNAVDAVATPTPDVSFKPITNPAVVITEANYDSSHDIVGAFEAEGGRPPYKYTFTTAPSDSRITLDENGTIKVGKDANTGDYPVTVKATSADGKTASASFTIKVTNEYDAQYLAAKAKLDALQAELNKAIEDYSLVSGSNATFTLLQTAINGAANSIAWNDGDPKILGIPVSKQRAVTTINTAVDNITNGDTYKQFQAFYAAQVAPFTNVMTAFYNLQNYVTNNNVQDIKTLEAADAYINGLYDVYHALDVALNALNDAEGTIAQYLANGVIETIPTMLGGGIATVQTLANTQIGQLSEDQQGVAQALSDALFAEADAQLDNLPAISLADIVGYSGKIDEVLKKLTEFSGYTLALKDKAEELLNTDYEALITAKLAEIIPQLEAAAKTQINATRQEIIQQLLDEVADIREAVSNSQTVNDLISAWEKVQQVAEVAKDVIATAQKIEAALNQLPSSPEEWQAVGQEVLAEIQQRAYSELKDAYDRLASNPDVAAFAAKATAIAEETVKAVQGLATLIQATGQPGIVFSDLQDETPFATVGTNYDVLIDKQIGNLGSIRELLSAIGVDLVFEVNGNVPFTIVNDQVVDFGSQAGETYTVPVVLLLKLGSIEIQLLTSDDGLSITTKAISPSNPNNPGGGTTPSNPGGGTTPSNPSNPGGTTTTGSTSNNGTASSNNNNASLNSNGLGSENNGDGSITGNDAVEDAVLKAWAQNGVLKISGLTTGKAYYVFTIQGALIYQSVAEATETFVNLPGRGVYIVVAGEKKVKVLF